jgi:hypothetical protein
LSIWKNRMWRIRQCIIRCMFRLEVSHQWHYKYLERDFMRLAIRVILIYIQT